MIIEKKVCDVCGSSRNVMSYTTTMLKNESDDSIVGVTKDLCERHRDRMIRAIERTLKAKGERNGS